ncbi:caprin-2-like, partial, partial [Argonauta hians]
LVTQGNCSCKREIKELKEHLEFETMKRIEMQDNLEMFFGELYNLKSKVGPKPTPTPTEIQQKPTIYDYDEIAFSSRLSQHLNNVKVNETIVFDNIVTNFGNAYNPETGIFISPMKGTYQFFVKILSGFNEKVETALIANNIEVTRLYSGAQHAHGSSSAAVFIALDKGEEVYVKALYQKSNHIHGVYSTFGGYLLRPF